MGRTEPSAAGRAIWAISRQRRYRCSSIVAIVAFPRVGAPGQKQCGWKGPWHWLTPATPRRPPPGIAPIPGDQRACWLGGPSPLASNDSQRLPSAAHIRGFYLEVVLRQRQALVALENTASLIIRARFSILQEEDDTKDGGIRRGCPYSPAPPCQLRHHHPHVLNTRPADRDYYS